MRLRSLLTGAAFLSASLTARADTFAFTFGNSSSQFNGSGVFTTGILEAPGEYLIATVSGTAATAPNGPNRVISSILAPGLFPTPANGGSFPANDNTLFVINGVGSLSQDGLSFILGDGAQVNLFNDGPSVDAMLERANGTVVYEAVPITIGAAVTPTPEPSSFALLATGLMGVVRLTRHRRR